MIEPQRYSFNTTYQLNAGDPVQYAVEAKPDQNGRYVTYTDAKAWVEREVEAVRDATAPLDLVGALIVQAEQRGHEQGQRATLASLDACQSVEDAVALLKTIGLDITYTDEGLRVIARQVVRYGQRDMLTRCLAAVEALPTEIRTWGALPNSFGAEPTVDLLPLLAALRALAPDGGE